MRCPRLPAVSMGMAKSKVSKYGLGTPGEIPSEGLGRAPAVMRAACVPATRARAESSAGLKYKAASDNVCKSQDSGGHGDIGWPRFCSKKERSSGSARFRDSSREAVTPATIGAGWYRCIAQPAKNKIPKRVMISVAILFIEHFSLEKEP